MGVQAAGDSRLIRAPTLLPPDRKCDQIVVCFGTSISAGSDGLLSEG